MNAGINCVHSLTHVLSSCPFMFFMVRCITSRLCVFALNIPGFKTFIFLLLSFILLQLFFTISDFVNRNEERRLKLDGKVKF